MLPIVPMVGFNARAADVFLGQVLPRVHTVVSSQARTLTLRDLPVWQQQAPCYTVLCPAALFEAFCRFVRNRDTNSYGNYARGASPNCKFIHYRENSLLARKRCCNCSAHHISSRQVQLFWVIVRIFFKDFL
jgi:hypothetical protein